MALIRRRQRSPSPKKEWIWVQSLNLGTTLAPGTSVRQALVIGADWDRTVGASFEKGAVLTRMVGSIHCIPDLAPTGGVITVFTWPWYIAKTDVDFAATLLGSNNLVAYADTDILQTGLLMGIKGAGAANTPSAWVEEAWNQRVDVKVKRKLTSEDSITLVATNNGPSSLSVSVMFRCLIQLP